MTTSQDWERRRNRWAEYKAQQEGNAMTHDETRDNTTAIEATIIAADVREWDGVGEQDEIEDDGQPSEYEEWQGYFGGDDWDFGEYDQLDQ
jgi:hypothetical protein